MRFTRDMRSGEVIGSLCGVKVLCKGQHALKA